MSVNMPKVLEVLTYPHLILDSVAQEVEEITAEIKQLAEDMIATMHEQEGIGLAANQVSVLKRLIVLDIQDESAHGLSMPLALVNPRITYSSAELNTYQEGCLSLPKISANVVRPRDVNVSFLDLEGKEHTIEASGLLATCLQHEIDHLDGILFIKRLSALKRDVLLKKYKKLNA